MLALRALLESRPAHDRWVCLMYHEIETQGRPLVDADPGYAVYAVTRETFRDHMKHLKDAGLRGASISEARSACSSHTVAITFDDGCETDWTEAAPVLKESGFGATFYVLAGFLGTRGYLSTSQLRELAQSGFDIGSHSVSHRMLTTLSAAEVSKELAESKACLEDVAGVSVRNFSCPHGRWSTLIETIAREVGYETVATSQVGLNTRRASPMALRRVAVQRPHDATALTRIARGENLWKPIVRNGALDGLKGIFGEAGYAAFRSTVMRAKNAIRR